MSEPLRILAGAGWGHRAAVWEGVTVAGGEIHGRALPGHEPEPGMPPPACTLESAAASWAGDWDVVMGWSLGGLAALRGVQQGQFRPRALILVATPPSFLERPGFPAGMPRTHLKGFQSGLNQDLLGTLRRFYALQFRGDRAPRSRWAPAEVRDRYLASDVDPQTLAGWLEVLADTDLTEEPPNLEMPALLIHGSEDAVVDPEAAQFFRDCGTQVSVATITGAGHAPHITHPQETGRRIGDFLRAITDRSPL